MISVSAFYTIAWLPYNVNFLLVSYLTFYDSGGYYATSFIAFFYTCANPFIYATQFDPVRQILRKMIPWKKTPVQLIDGPRTTGNPANAERPGQNRY